MHWKLFANLAETAGSREIEVTVDSDSGPDVTVGDALDALLSTHPELREEVLDDDGDLYEHVRLLHNAEDPFANGDGLDTRIEQGDELALFPPVSGG